MGRVSWLRGWDFSLPCRKYSRAGHGEIPCTALLTHKKDVFTGSCPQAIISRHGRDLGSSGSTFSSSELRGIALRLSFEYGFGQNFCFPVNQVIRLNGGFQCGSAESVYRRAKAFLGVGVFPIPKHHLFNYFRDLIGRKGSGESCTHALYFSPGSTYEYTARRGGFLGDRPEGAFADTHAALLAFGFIKDRLSVSHGNGFGGAMFCDKTLFAASAKLTVKREYSAALNANVIKARFHTAVRATANTDLKLMRKLDIAHP